MSEWGRDRNRDIYRKYRQFRHEQTDAFLWPWGDLNTVFGKIVPGWVYMVGARPKNGKTTFLMNLYSYLNRQNVSALVFGTELDPAAMVLKWSCIETGVSELAAFQNELSDAEQELVDQKAVELLKPGLVTFSDATNLTLEKIAGELQDAAMSGALPDVVVVDHIHFLSQDREELNYLAKEFSEMAKGAKIVALLAAQLNRGQSELDLYLPPKMDRIKGSGAIEEYMTAGFGLYRPLRRGLTNADYKRIRAGESDPKEYSYPDTMAVTCMAHRYHGDAMHKTVKLRLRGSKLRSFTPESLRQQEEEDDDGYL